MEVFSDLSLYFYSDGPHIEPPLVGEPAPDTTSEIHNSDDGKSRWTNQNTPFTSPSVHDCCLAQEVLCHLPAEPNTVPKLSRTPLPQLQSCFKPCALTGLASLR